METHFQQYTNIMPDFSALLNVLFCIAMMAVAARSLSTVSTKVPRPGPSMKEIEDRIHHVLETQIQGSIDTGMDEALQDLKDAIEQTRCKCPESKQVAADFEQLIHRLATKHNILQKDFTDLAARDREKVLGQLQSQIEDTQRRLETRLQELDNVEQRFYDRFAALKAEIKTYHQVFTQMNKENASLRTAMLDLKRHVLVPKPSYPSADLYKRTMTVEAGVQTRNPTADVGVQTDPPTSSPHSPRDRSPRPAPPSQSSHSSSSSSSSGGSGSDPNPFEPRGGGGGGSGAFRPNPFSGSGYDSSGSNPIPFRGSSDSGGYPRPLFPRGEGLPPRNDDPRTTTSEQKTLQTKPTPPAGPAPKAVRKAHFTPTPADTPTKSTSTVPKPGNPFNAHTPRPAIAPISTTPNYTPPIPNAQRIIRKSVFATAESDAENADDRSVTQTPSRSQSPIGEEEPAAVSQAPTTVSEDSAIQPQTPVALAESATLEEQTVSENLTRVDEPKASQEPAPSEQEAAIEKSAALEEPAAPEKQAEFSKVSTSRESVREHWRKKKAAEEASRAPIQKKPLESSSTSSELPAQYPFASNNVPKVHVAGNEAITASPLTAQPEPQKHDTTLEDKTVESSPVQEQITTNLAPEYAESILVQGNAETLSLSENAEESEQNVENSEIHISDIPDQPVVSDDTVIEGTSSQAAIPVPAPEQPENAATELANNPRPTPLSLQHVRSAHRSSRNSSSPISPADLFSPNGLRSRRAHRRAYKHPRAISKDELLRRRRKQPSDQGALPATPTNEQVSSPSVYQPEIPTVTRFEQVVNENEFTAQRPQYEPTPSQVIHGATGNQQDTQPAPISQTQFPYTPVNESGYRDMALGKSSDSPYTEMFNTYGYDPEMAILQNLQQFIGLETPSRPPPELLHPQGQTVSTTLQAPPTQPQTVFPVLDRNGEDEPTVRGNGADDADLSFGLEAVNLSPGSERDNDNNVVMREETPDMYGGDRTSTNNAPHHPASHDLSLVEMTDAPSEAEAQNFDELNDILMGDDFTDEPALPTAIESRNTTFQIPLYPSHRNLSYQRSSSHGVFPPSHGPLETSPWRLQPNDSPLTINPQNLVLNRDNDNVRNVVEVIRTDDSQSKVPILAPQPLANQDENEISVTPTFGHQIQMQSHIRPRPRDIGLPPPLSNERRFMAAPDNDQPAKQSLKRSGNFSHDDDHLQISPEAPMNPIAGLGNYDVPMPSIEGRDGWQNSNFRRPATPQQPPAQRNQGPLSSEGWNPPVNPVFDDYRRASSSPLTLEDPPGTNPRPTQQQADDGRQIKQEPSDDENNVINTGLSFRRLRDEAGYFTRERTRTPSPPFEAKPPTYWQPGDGGDTDESEPNAEDVRIKKKARKISPEGHGSFSPGDADVSTNSSEAETEISNTGIDDSTPPPMYMTISDQSITRSAPAGPHYSRPPTPSGGFQPYREPRDPAPWPSGPPPRFQPTRNAQDIAAAKKLQEEKEKEKEPTRGPGDRDDEVDYGDSSESERAAHHRRTMAKLNQNAKESKVAGQRLLQQYAGQETGNIITHYRRPKRNSGTRWMKEKNPRKKVVGSESSEEEEEGNGNVKD